MDYKCKHNGKYGCEICKYVKENKNGYGCKLEFNPLEASCFSLKCPMISKSTYPIGMEICEKCKFEPKEDDKEMIMTEVEMDEQLEMMEQLEEEGYYDDDPVEEWVRVDDGLITVKLSKEQIKNILEFFDMRFIMFVQDEGDEIDNIWYLESMSTAYATLARAIGQEPKGER